MLQLWVLPDELGQPAGYKLYPIEKNGVTHIYGGSKGQSERFDSKTNIKIVRLTAGESIEFEHENLTYVSTGDAKITDENSTFDAREGDLIRSHKTEIKSVSDTELVVVY